MRVFLFHSILTFPREFRSMPSIPTNFDEFDTAPASFINFPIRNLSRFFSKVERVIDVNFISRNDHCILCWTFSQIGYMECIVNTMEFSR
ncbi:hypothetical protein Hanom_Chr04g00334221 [Helianthus anomalus]